VSSASSVASPPRRPYPGLEPYSEDRADLFFGRDREREIIVANLSTSRLTLLYGASGVGKSSLLRAGVAHTLRRSAHEQGEDGVPPHVVVLFAAWAGDPTAGLADAIRLAVNEAVGAQIPANRSIVGTLESCADSYPGEVLVIADQFDEFFVYHPNEHADAPFGVELGRAVARRDLRVNVLVAIREDAVAKLDLFKGRIPGLFESRLRIDHLTRDGGEAAIRKPLEWWNRHHAFDGDGVTIEDELVAAVLEQVQVGKVTLGQAGVGESKGAETVADLRVQAPFLQLVMTRLWDAEIDSGSRTLRRATLTGLGEAGRIIETHLYEALNDFSELEQDIAARVLRHLVTPSGTKIAHSVDDLAAYADRSAAEVSPVLERLASTARVLRKVTGSRAGGTTERFEIFHDALAPAVLDWLDQHTRLEELATAEQRRLELESGFREAPDRVTFAELARAQFAYGREAREAGMPSPASEARYRVLLAVFEQNQGTIVDSYWSHTAPGGVALTFRGSYRPLWVRLFRAGEAQLSFHRSTEEVTRYAPQVEDVLQRCNMVAIRASSILTGASLHTVMQMLLSVSQHALGFVDRAEGKPNYDETDYAARREEGELRRIEHELRTAADRAARIVYAQGLFLGLLLLAAVAAAPVLIFDPERFDLSTRIMAACAAGALGSVVSVLSRMGRREGFAVDYDLGRRALRLLGASRPLVGALIGVVVVFAFEATVVYIFNETDEDTRYSFLDRAPYLVALGAFAAGFAERWLDILLGRRGTVASSPDSPPPLRS
jgi:hypothetical protein